MKIRNIKYFAIALILLCCLMGAASASEDVSLDIVDASADDAVVVDAVSEDASDYVESTVVDDSVSVAQDEVELENVVGDYSYLEDNVEKLGENSNDLLSENVVSLYVNGSMLQDEELLPDGSSWETAVGAPFSIYIAPALIIDNGGTEGIIYIAQGDYSDNFNLNSDINITFIGYDEDTALPDISTPVYGSGAMNVTYTFINLTFTKLNLEISANFINCTFINPNFNIMKDLNEVDQRHVEEYGYAKTYFMNFDNCVFKDVNTDNALITLYKYGAPNFNNCTFENIVADSLVYRNATTYFEEDGISFKNCTFTNCKYNGIVDSAANFDDVIAIEDCNYDSEVAVGTTEVDGHFYVNATKLKVVPVDSDVDISSSEKGVVVIALTDNNSAPIAGATVKYTVNGGDEQTDVTGEDGKITLTGLTGEVTIAISYEGNESFNPITGSQFFNFTEEPATNDTNDTPVTPTKVATKLTAPKVTATYNVAKKLVITLKDANGKVLANKKVTVKVGTISKTLKTNAKGQVSVAVNTLVPKTYTASIKFAGDDDYKASSVSAKVVVKKAAPKLAAAKKTFKVKAKTKKVTATLKNNKGKVLKKVKLTLKIGKKTYTAKTNSKGVATFKVKLTKKGTYTGTVKFVGSKYYKAASKNVKIIVKK